MAGVEESGVIFDESKSNVPTLQPDSEKQEKQESDERRVEAMDSFERIEAEILQEYSDEGKQLNMTGFVEDYTMKEGTTFDAELASPRELRKQPKFDELAALDLQWRRAHQQQQTKDTGEVDEKALERLEVAALIKKAEEKLLPADRDESTVEEFQEETAGVAEENQEFVPELVKLDKIISAADLIRMESSDLSEEEGFRLRLSCIFEESESDTSGSGSATRTAKHPVRYIIEPGGEGTKKEGEESKPMLKCAEQKPCLDPVEKIAPENVEQALNETSSEKTLEIFQAVNVLDDVQVITDREKQTSAKDDQCTGTAPNQAKQITDENKSLRDDNENVSEHNLSESKSSDHEAELDSNRLTKENVTIFDGMEKRETLLPDTSEVTESVESSSPEPPYAVRKFGANVESADLLDSVESSSPEPTFGIRRLQSGTRVDKLLTRPSLAKRLESSSDSSLDISTATTSPGAEDLKTPESQTTTQMDAEEMTEIQQTLDNNVELYISDTAVNETTHSEAVVRSNLDISTLSSLQGADTSDDNVCINVDSRKESPAPSQSIMCDPIEIKDDEPATLFKLGRIRRGKSLEQELPAEYKDDGRSVASFDIHQATEEQLQNMFPKVKKGRRGKSLESGMAEKEAQNQENSEEKSQLETSSQTGEEERPPVPPETYLWEELRRWRVKGGYPWTYLDKPPFDEKTWKNKMDHEYEPINPPPQDKKSPERTDSAEAATPQDEDVANTRRFLRIPRDEELVVSAVSPEDMEVEAIGAARDFQDDLEDRFLQTSMTTTTASRTDCDVNTSMLDSSGLEDLPLKRDSRSKKALQTKTEQMRAQAQGLQQRIRSQAGKLRNKLRSIPRPSFQRKQERANKSEEEEKPRFRLPDRPKFTLPERPKFNLPERPKFKMPQKPKISLPNFTKPLRERQATQGKTPGEPKKNMFDLDFRTYPRMFNKKSRDRGEYATSSPKMPRSATPPPAPIQPARKKGPVGQRWVNRFDDIKFVDDRGSELSHRSDRSEHSESLSGFHDKDFAIADDLENTQLPPPRTLSTKSSISHISDRELQSSRSSEDRHRKGVLEEIDSDQFFLRQKGISEDDIDMGKYLSDEIREAFRSPVVNALRQLDIDYDERTIEKLQEKSKSEEPLPPNRTRSLKRTPKMNSTEERTLEKEVATPLPPAEEEPSKIRYENVQESSSKPRYDNVDEDNVSEYYKSPPPPQEYQHYKVPRPTPQPTPSKRKSSGTEQTPNKKKHNEGWVEVEVETSFEEITPEAVASPQPLQRKKSRKSLEGRQLSQDTPNKVEEIIEPDYIVPAEIPPDAPKRTRSLSRGARSIHSMAREEEKNKPVPTKRTSSKKSLQSLGLSNDPPRKDPDSRSVHSLALEDRRAGAVAPKRIKSLSRGSRSFQSLANDGDVNETATPPQPPERMRSLSRNSHASRSYHSLADDERSWAPQAPDRTRSLSRPSKSKQPPKSSEEEQAHHYETPSEDGYAGYAVVEKPKPPRPPPPRRRKGSRSPTFNTLPRRSPIRPVRNYATLGPSRPPRRSKPIKPAQSLEHIYSSDQISQAYAQVESSLQATHVEELHGSNKDLQATNVIEKMKGRPLPAPPRPPRFKGKSEEQNSSLDVEEVEEVCVSTQTDPLPDDVCLEDDIIQEFSHEQLRIQEEFLKDMREEEERIQREIEAKRARHIDVTEEKEQNEAKMEIIRQMDDIIREERRLLLDERQAEEDNAQEEAKKAQQLQLQVHEDDMGYASLDRRQTRPDEEPQPSTSFQQPLPPPRTIQATLRPEPAPPAPTIPPQEPVYIPLVPEIVSTERLRVGQLEVDRLSVNQLEATSLTVQDLRTNGIQTQDVRGTSLQIQDIISHSGQLNLRNIELPPEFIQQIITRIPWEEIRPPHNLTEQEAVPATVHTATAPRRVPVTEEEQTQSSAPQSVSTRRRHRALRQRSRSQYSSDDDSGESRQVSSRRPPRTVLAEPRVEVTIGELGQQLARACTSAGLRAMRTFAAHVRPPAVEEDRTRYVQAVLLVALVAIAGFVLFSLNTKDVHHHHWDFQFPPQPPRQ